MAEIFLTHENLSFDAGISWVYAKQMKRLAYESQIQSALHNFPVVALLGPRQVGKTTLARDIFAAENKETTNHVNYFDLENPRDLARLADPMLALEKLHGLVVIDEIQLIPNLFPLLRVLVDRPNNTLKLLILGSASQELIQQSSETLAGRIKFIRIDPFDLQEVGFKQIDNLWLRGGYPRAWLAETNATAFDWLEQYARTFLERDIPQLGFNIPAAAMRRFWMMVTHYHGQLLNYAELARSLDISEKQARRYLDILVGTFMVRRLQPWHVNIDKRQVKTPKLFFRDSGIFHLLSGITSKDDLLTSPRLGVSWEGFALEHVLRLRGIRDEDAYFWAVHQQCDIDLLTIEGPNLLGFEIKHTSTPKVTESMLTALKTLQLKQIYIVYPGEMTLELHPQIKALPLTQCGGLSLEK